MAAAQQAIDDVLLAHPSFQLDEATRTLLLTALRDSNALMLLDLLTAMGAPDDVGMHFLRVCSGLLGMLMALSNMVVDHLMLILGKNEVAKLENVMASLAI
jgi:hypothetical protein